MDSFPVFIFGTALFVTLVTVFWTAVHTLNHDDIPIASIVVSAPLITWCVFFFSVRRWRKELLLSRQQESKQKKFLDTLLNHMPLSIFAKDVKDDYKIVLVNRRAEEVLAVPKEKLLGTTDYDNWPREEADFFRSTDEKVMREQKVVEIEAEPVTTSKGTFTAHTLKIPIYDEDGKPSILLAILEDVTEKIKFHQDLQQAKIDADKANQAKSEFLAKMSHELRTPLNSIMGMTRILIEEESLSAEHKDMAETVYKSAINLLEIVNDILDISKIEAGGMTLESIGFDLKDVIGNLMNAMAPVASGKGVVLKAHYGPVDLPYLKGDPTRLGRIMTNLVSNAIKYTRREDGSCGSLPETITITVDATPPQNGMIDVMIAVQDTGIGIPTDKLDIIFDKFTQADESITRLYGGTGLGLSITKELVEMMGGTIGVDSVIGKGSTFWFRIPFPVTSLLDCTPDKETNHDSASVRIPRTLRIPSDQARLLVAEDHLLNQNFIAKLLNRMGFLQIDIVADGFDVLRALDTREYDLILMDCHMPRKNGYDTAREVRERGRQKGQYIPIVALTADAMKGTAERCRESGMDDYVIKPINPHILKETLSHWISFPHTAGGLQAEAPEDVPADTALLEQYVHGREEAQQFITLFFKQSEEILTLMELHAAERDALSWKEAAHKFKGGAATMGAHRLRQLAQVAENAAEPLSQPAILQDLNTEYGRVKYFLLHKFF